MSSIDFRAVCFSTNFSNYSSMAIMKQYFLIAECTDINYLKDYHIHFKHKLLLENGSQMQYSNSYYEISNFSKSSKACDQADCFIIFFDLENSESVMEINKILKFIKSTCDEEKKINLINIYTVESNIKSNYTDENLKGYFKNYNLNNYDISKVNLDSSDDLAKVIDSITEEILKEKKIGNKILGLDNSTSKCIIS